MTIYSYYVYAYLREADNTPYYIGKGRGKRMYAAHRVKLPSKKSNIVIYQSGLSEQSAYELEIAYIKLFGRKDLGTGILRNQTNGGDGGNTSNTPAYLEAKRKNLFNGHIHKSEEVLRRANKKRSKTLMNHIVSDETRAKISRTRKERKIPSPAKGKKRSEETKQKLRKPKEKYTCSVCQSIVGGKANLIRWHEDNCKMKGK
jgi:NUMOD3 motif